MVADERVSRLHAEAFLGRANGKTFEAIQRLLEGTGKRPLISSSLLSTTEAGALGLPQSVISSVQDLARPLVDVLSRGGKGWRGYRKKAAGICALRLARVQKLIVYENVPSPVRRAKATSRQT